MINEGRKRRGGNDGPALTQEELQPKKVLDLYVEELVGQTTTSFFSTYNPDMIEEALDEYLKDNDVVPQTNAGKYKMKFTMQTEVGPEEEAISTKMCCSISKVNDDMVCVEFTKVFGD